MASKTQKKDASQVSAGMQWAFLAGLAILGVVAVFVFGIGTGSGAGGYGGMINLLGMG